MSEQSIAGSEQEQLPQTMKAAVMTEPGKIVFQELPIPSIGDSEVLIKVMAVGICGSDLHYYEHGRIGRFIVEKPLILGHECAGIVAAVGKKVSSVTVGTRVAIEPGTTCGHCSACKEGRYNLCPDVSFLATPPIDGAFVQYLAVREDMVFPIPDHLSYEEAALNEPFSVGIHAARRSKLQPGDTVAIMGMGPVGLMAVAAAKAFGAAQIFVSDMEEIRLEAALKMGATHAIHAKNEDPASVVKRLTGGKGVDVAWETAGNPHALRSALYSLRRGGKLAIVGLPPQDETPLSITFIADNEIDLYGIFRYANTYPSGISFLASDSIDASFLITDRYPLAKTQEALERAIHNKSGSLKVVVYPNE
ncbi:L-iditol 2-dehydrogenase [Paenibacillus algorifonticola]|uniref:L-iditol 2-dehydrogenase n=1 Tax=Paenibacillus algorifonticola TaxID=684063 RepID=A0A1I1Y3N4_9BACL|nr:NAD(P)-dependent alcohol dehydrogenase [Paenibacillus algorifonticola]SFE12430.1 L-iditol 2-dehydrogenase [Paenibacillus algorifonticola]